MREKTTETRAKRATQSAPYLHGKGYAIRRRYQGHDIFLSGFPTAKSALRAANQRMVEIDQNRKPVGAGATRTTLAQALQDYAMARLPFLKGAPQEARRINNYLRAAGLSLLEVRKVPDDELAVKTGSGAYFEVELTPHTTERAIPQGLSSHRKALLTANARTEKHRAVLATTVIADVHRNDVSALLLAMRRDKNAPSTIHLERALLRVVFNYAYVTWEWSEIQDNPATRLRMPKVDNNRSRVISADEQVELDNALAECRNTLVGPTVRLLTATGMRCSEPIERAQWGDVDWDRRVLTLRDAKTGKRDVPLSPAAIAALRELGPGEPKEHIVRITYEALRAAWQRVCKRAGVKGANLQDLRHTAATRMALKTGNVFLVRALTGHKTIKMLERYVNVSADDVVKVMHDPAPREADAAASQARGVAPETDSAVREAELALPSNVVKVSFGRRVA